MSGRRRILSNIAASTRSKHPDHLVIREGFDATGS